MAGLNKLHMLNCKNIFNVFKPMTVYTKCNIRKLCNNTLQRQSQCLHVRSNIKLTCQFSRQTSSDSKSKENEEIVATDDKQLMTPEEQEKWARETLSLSLKERFKVYTDEDSDVILDADEINRLEQFEVEEEPQFSVYSQDEDEFAGYNLERGKRGVFDVEELVEVLRSEKAKDICVICVPRELHYTDYLIITSAISVRHAIAMAEFLRKLHKRKKYQSDPYVEIDGKKSSPDWKVMDFGNIVLHIFLPEKREQYDLESLWTVGREYDELTRQKSALDNVLELVQPHVKYFEDSRHEKRT